MHTGEISKLVYGFASVRVIIHLLKLVDYLPVQTHKPYCISINYYVCICLKHVKVDGHMASTGRFSPSSK